MDATTKTCTTCGETKPLEDFNRRTTSRDGRQPRCRACTSAADRVPRGRVEQNRRAVWAHLKTHPCVDCGESDLVVLDFDHRDPTQKIQTVAALTRTAPLAVLLAEIAKCDVRCGNCHRIRTVEQLGYWRALFGSLGDAG